jgi:hypothetical protein
MYFSINLIFGGSSEYYSYTLLATIASELGAGIIGFIIESQPEIQNKAYKEWKERGAIQNVQKNRQPALSLVPIWGGAALSVRY